LHIAYLALRALIFKANQFENFTKDPIAVQRKLLLQYLNRNKNTRYGKKYHFSQVRSIEDYRLLVPISDSESLFPYIERVKNGEKNILTKDKVIFFGLTSGTTGKQKLIPVTNFSRSKKAETMQLWSYYITKDHPDVLDGKVLAIINPDNDDYTESGIPIGAESGHAYRNMPMIVKNFYAIPYNVFLIQDYESRYYCMLRIALEKNITTIATLNPNTIILLCHKLEKYKDELIQDIEKGTLSSSLKIPPYVRNLLFSALKPNPVRAAQLRGILNDKGALLPKDIWPNIKLIECWKGGTVKLYLKELPQYFGDVPVRDFGCLSTEARSSIPMSDSGAGGVLAIRTNFYEFIPKEDMGKDKKRFLLCDELEKGKEYYLIVTTPGGLYRYNIDDIITVTGFFNKTPVIEFVQKGLNAVSIMGEKLYESQVNEAFNRVVDKHKVLIDFFSACAEKTPPRYIFLIEFENGSKNVDKKELLKSIEEELGKENSEYKYARDSQLLKPPVLKVVKNGEFEKYRVMRVSKGANDSQFKVAELTADNEFDKNFAIEEEVYLD
jgi:hypothetical protein